MYADLNIPWPTSHLIHLFKQQTGQQARKGKGKATEPKESVDVWKGVEEEEKKRLREQVECAIRLGYSVIAFNLIIPQNFDPLLLQAHFPFASTQPPFPDLDPRTAPGVSQNGYGRTILQLSRLTMVMDETVAGGGKGVFGFSTSQSTYLSKYSLLSALPLDAGAFSHACLSLSPPTASGIDIITLDLCSSPKLPFQMSLSTVSKALEHNIGFEICYSPTTTLKSVKAIYSAYTFPCLVFPQANTNNSVPHPVRRNLVAGAKDLIRVTNRGRGLIFSSAATQWAELRAPDDIANFGNVLGLSQDAARRALTSNPKSIVSKAISTRQTHKGVVSNPVVVTISTPTTTETPHPPPGPSHEGLLPGDQSTTSDVQMHVTSTSEPVLKRVGSPSVPESAGEDETVTNPPKKKRKTIANQDGDVPSK
ncbi:hypothetical protein CROQUDRAFT_48671 [Cronartium quercuum f. sp. fusiforme G11]|uniref:Uncharacterized protein n=1 Tax=Cronartium quercuum f. sp. fusiforme G11 TaxID=708437 RepID=A0A9P6NDF3_9BASI|nr:hypothetical protein CROQUDRAFT_48671 [Cronartium quercuum f. sp. fusiforme G11]